MFHFARLVLLLITCSCGLSAATVTWTGLAGDGNWGNAGNWTGGSGIPTSADIAAFTGSPAVTVNSAGATAASITGSALITLSTSGTLTVSGMLTASTITLAGGTLKNATVQANLVATSANASTLTAVTIASGALLDLSQASSTCYISSGLTVNGSVYLGNSVGTVYGRLYWLGTQQWGGTGDILFGSSSYNFIDEDDGGNQTLTLAYPLTIHGQAGYFYADSNSSLINQAAISCNGTSADMTIATGTLNNQGSISGQGGGTTVVISVANWNNSGNIAVAAGGALTLTATGTGINTGLISDSSGSLTINGTSSAWSTVGAGSLAMTSGTLTLGGTWSAVAGAITTSGTPSAPATLNLGGTFTTAQGMLVGYTAGATTVNVTGTMTNSAGLTLTSATGPWYLAGGTINGGSITGTGTNTLVGTTLGGILNNVTITAGTIVDLTQKYNVACTITGGLTDNGSIHVGSSDGTFRGILYWTNTQQWGGTGDILFGNSTSNVIDEEDADNQILTLLSPLNIHGPAGTIDVYGTLINQTTISCTSSTGMTCNLGTLTNANTGSIISEGLGTTITLATTNWSNSGLIEATGSSSLTLTTTGVGTNTGSIASTASTVTFSGGTWSTTGAQSVLATGGTLTLGGAWSGPSGAIVTTGSASVPMVINLAGTFTTAQALLVGYSLGVTTVNITGAMTNTPSLVLGTATGPWYLAGGTINGGSITSTALNPLILGTSGTLAGGITLTGSSVIDGSQVNGANCTFTGGMTDNGTILLGNASGSLYGRLFWTGTQTLAGSGSILFGGTTYDGLYENDSGQTLTTNLFMHGNDATIYVASTSTLINQGIIACDVAGGAFDLYGNFNLQNASPGSITSGASGITGATVTLNVGTWSNSGSIVADSGDTLIIAAVSAGTNTGTLGSSAGTFQVTGAGAWSSTAALSLSGSTVVDLGGSLTTAQAKALLIGCPVPGTVVNITGMLNNAGGMTLDGTTGPWFLKGGTISGGTVTTTGSDTLVMTATGGTLAGVTIGSNGVLDGTQANGGSVTITGGITINGQVLLGNPTTAAYCRMYWSGNQTIAGSGSITFGDSIYDGIFENDSGSTLTTAVTINGADGEMYLSSTSTLLNQGTIQCDATGGGFDLYGGFILSNDTGGSIISGTADFTGATVTMNVGSWTNAGTITACANDSVIFVTATAASPGANTGTLHVQSGTMTLAGAWTSSNAMVISGTSVINLGGTFTTAQATAILTGCPAPATRVNITGAMDNATNLTLTSTTGPWFLSGGTITGGTITTNSTNELVLTNTQGTLAGVTIPTGSTLDASLVNGANALVTGGITVNGSVLLGNLSGTNYGRLFWSGTQIFGGSGIITCGGSSYDGIFENDSSQTLTIQATIQGQYASINLGATSVLANQGSILCNVANGGFYINGGSASVLNTGTIASTATADSFSFAVSSLNNQGNFIIGSTVAENWSQTGTFTQTTAGTLTMLIGGTATGAFDVFSVTGQVTLAGTLALASVNGYYPQQGNAFAILTSSSTPTGTMTSSNAKYSLTYPTTGVVAHAVDTSNPTVAVSVAATTSASPIPFTITFSEPVNAITNLSSGFTVQNGTVGTPTGGPVVWTVPVTPTIATGSIFLEVNAGATTNLNSAANVASNIASTTYNQAPGLTITVSPTPTNGVVTAVPTFTITSTVAVSLNSSLLAIQGASLGTISPSSGQATAFSVPVTMSGAGNVTFQVLAGATTDTAGGVNLATPVTSVTYAPASQIVWSGAISSAWNTTGNWVGNALPGTNDNVIIPIGSTVVYSSGTTAGLHTIDLQGSLNITGGTLQVNGGSGNDNIITLNGGSLNMAGGILSSAIVQLGSGGSFTGGTGGGTLSGVTIAAGTTFDMSQINDSAITVSGSLAVNGSVLIGAPSSTSYATMYWSGTQSWSGSGQVVFGQSANDTITCSATGTLTIASPLAIHGQHIYFNCGPGVVDTQATSGGIYADMATSTITFSGGGWNNTGIIQTIAGNSLTVQSACAWTNTGTITGTGTTYYLGGTFPSSSAVTFPSQTSNTINITGTMNLNGNGAVLTGANSPWYMDGGTLMNGSITSATTESIIATGSNGSLQNVTLGQNIIVDLTQVNGATLMVSGNMTDNGIIEIGAGGSGNYGVLYWVNGAQSWGGTGQIIFGQSTSNGINCSGGTSLTILAPLSIHGQQVAFNNNGTNSTLITQSALATDSSGANIEINNASGCSWTNTGAIQAVAGSSVSIVGAGTWSNTGAITGSSSTFNLGGSNVAGSFSAASAMTFSQQSGNTINITGVMNLSLGNAVMTPSAPWMLDGGTFLNGTINGTGSVIATTNSGALNNVVIGPNVTFDMSQTTGSYAYVSNNLTVNGTVLIGASASTSYAVLYWTGTQSWGGSGNIIFGESTNNGINTSNGVILTIISPLAIHGQAVTFNVSGSTLLTNSTPSGVAGLATDTSSSTLTVNYGSWTNTGTISLASGSTLSTGGTVAWGNSGVVTATGATVDLGGTFNSTSALTFGGTTGNIVNIVGAMANGTTTLSSSTGPWNLDGGTITGGTINGSGTGSVIATTGGGTLSGIVLNGTLDLSRNSGCYCNIAGNLTLNGIIQIGASNNANYGTVDWSGTQIWSGSGQIIFGVSTGNALNGSGTSLTIASPISIHGLSMNLAGSASTLITQGQISTDAQTSALLVNMGTWTNTASITTTPGGTVSIVGSGAWTNAGSVTGSNTVYNLGANFNSTTAETFNGLNGNTVNITGNLNNALNSALTATTGPWYLRGGTITGGSVTGSGADTLIGTNSSGTLSGVTIAANTTFDLGQINGANCNITNGITVNGTVQIGSPTNTDAATLYWSGSQAWGGSGTGQIQFGQSNANYITPNAASTTLTLSSGLLIHGINGRITDSGYTCTLINQGSIQSDVAGGSMDITFGTWSNRGTISIGAGTVQQWNCSGAFTQTSTGILNMLVGGLGNSSNLAITGTANLGGTIVIATTSGYVPIQGNAFTLLTTSASGVSGTFATITGPFTVAYQTASVVASAVDSTTPSVVVTSVNAVTKTSPIPYTLTFSEAVTAPQARGLTVANGSVSSIHGGPMVYTALVTPTLTSGTNGVVGLTVNASAAVNSGSIANTVSNLGQVTFETPPVVAVSPANGTVLTSAPTFTLTFSNPVSGLQANGLSLTGATLVAITPVPSTITSTYTVATSMTGAGAVQFQVLANAVVDQSGNGNVASTSETVSNDPNPPTIVSITPANNAVLTTSPTFVITFSEAVQGLTTSNMTLTGATFGTITPATGLSTTYNVPVIVSGSGIVELVVGTNAVVDALGGANAVGASDTVTVNNSPPSLTSIAPTSGSTLGGTVVTLTGSNFDSGATVAFGGVAAANVTITSSTSIQATTPPGAAGSVSVQVINGDLQTSSLSNAFLYILPPVITAIVPNTGSVSGGTSITITGANFHGSGVIIGGTAATSVAVVSSTTITAVAPPGSTGVANVVVVNTDGQTSTLANGFTYIGLPPTISSLTPTFGPSSGSTTVTITGAAFSGGASVLFGTVAATAVSTINSTTITAVSPAGIPGVVTVTVINGDLQQATLSNAFTYVPPPLIASISPVQGSPLGGTSVTITGTNFTAGADVLFAGTAATSVITVNATTITATSPAGTSGPCSITVINGDGQQSTLANAFSYLSQAVTVSSSISLTNTGPIAFTVTYLFPVSGLQASDLTVADGTIAAITGSGTTFTVTVTPTVDGAVALSVNANGLTGAPASNTQTVTYDTTPPSASLSISSTVPLTDASTVLTVAFSEVVTGFSLSPVIVNNGTASAFTTITASTYSFQITPTAGGLASIQIIIPAGICSDLAGNLNLAAALIVPVQSTVLSTTVVTPVVSVSSDTGTSYTAICPGTWAGLSQVQSFLTGKNNTQAVGYVWDATLQTYDQVPQQTPTGGWQPGQGVFLATRLTPTFNFNGFLSSVDYEVTLKPGWNFIGIPPLNDGGVETVAHQWADLRLEDTSGNLITGTDRVGLIDIGAWVYDGSPYSQDSGTLNSGIGYWIENASNPPVDLVLRRLSAAEIIGSVAILASANQQTRTVTIGYRPHSSPPSPPTGTSANKDTGSHGCGFGSGIGAMVLAFTVVMMRMRLRSRTAARVCS